MGNNCAVALTVMALGLAGCTATTGESPAGEERGKAGPPLKSRFDLANGCFLMKSGNGRFVARAGDGYAATAGEADAERFHLKPTALGRYLLHGRDATVMTGVNGAVTADAAATEGSDWVVDVPGAGAPGRYTLKARLGEDALGMAADGTLVMAAAAAAFVFEDASDCARYPEMPVGIPGETYTLRNPAQPVIGFAEVHSHMGMGHEMSDGTGDVGPAAGGVLYGQAMHRFGAPHALEDCEALHGPDGTLSPENIVLDQDPTQTHDTVGWPSFIGWPERDSQLHQQMYYRWVERAYKAGLRVMVIHGTNIEALCDIAKQTGNDKDADLDDTDCTDMGVGVKQVQYLYDIQDYVDAQEGGPGKGWFRIVRNPAEARGVIADGKMAVVPGLEFSNLFGCNVVFNPDGSETRACTRETIDSEIDRIWELGVRQVFPYHDVDSALGGTGIFSSALNYVGFYGTRGFWKTYPCEDGGEGPTYFYDAGAEMESGSFTQFNDPISQALIDNAQGQLPLYGPGRQCNARQVTDLGEYAIAQMMKKGFVLDIDHAEIKSKQYMLDVARTLTPNYPMVSGHGGHGGISVAQAAQIIAQGGIIYPSLPNGEGYVQFLDKLRPIWENSGTSRPFSVGYGADSNGLHNLPNVRSAGSTQIEYPFTLFQGPGWGGQFGAAGIKPLQVDLLSIPGGQSWNPDEVGMAHYGLVADIVEQVRLEGLEKGGADEAEKALNALYNSAETYLRMWEQTLQASQAARP